MQDLIRLVGPQRALELFGVQPVGLDAAAAEQRRKPAGSGAP